MTIVSVNARIKMPVMPNFLEVTGVEPTLFEQAEKLGALRVDVGCLDDAALQDFCNAWVLAFTRHAKARRVTKEPKEPKEASGWQQTREYCS